MPGRNFVLDNTLSYGQITPLLTDYQQSIAITIKVDIPSWRPSKDIETKLHKAFSKSKRSGTSLSASFSAWFLKKNIPIVIWY